MTLVTDLAIIADEFTTKFSFLPFKVVKPIIAAYYNAIAEINEFGRVLYKIYKGE